MLFISAHFIGFKRPGVSPVLLSHLSSDRHSQPFLGANVLAFPKIALMQDDGAFNVSARSWQSPLGVSKVLRHQVLAICNFKRAIFMDSRERPSISSELE